MGEGGDGAWSEVCVVRVVVRVRWGMMGTGGASLTLQHGVDATNTANTTDTPVSNAASPVSPVQAPTATTSQLAGPRQIRVNGRFQDTSRALPGYDVM